MRNWFACELHCHTLHSDGDFSVEELMRTARERLLDGINLTDHNTDSGVIETKAFCAPVVLPGMEWTTYFGHMLVLDCKQYVDWRDALPDTIDQKMRQVRESGGLCGVAHPFQLGTPICTGGHWDYHVRDWSLVHYIEIFSEGCPFLNSANRRAIALWQSLLDKGYHIAPTFGRDWHRTANNKLLSACTYLLCDGETLTPEKMKQALLSGRTCVSAGPLFYFETANGECVGDTIDAGETILTFYTDTTRFEALNTGDKMEPETVRLLTNGGEVALQMPWTGGARPTTVELLPGRWYRAELWGKMNGKPEQLLAASAALYTK